MDRMVRCMAMPMRCIALGKLQQRSSDGLHSWAMRNWACLAGHSEVYHHRNLGRLASALEHHRSYPT